MVLRPTTDRLTLRLAHQIVGRRGADRLSRDGPVSIQVGRDQRRVAAVDVVGVEPIGHAAETADVLQREQEAGRLDRHDALKLLVRDSVDGDLGDLVQEQPANVGDRSAGPQGGGRFRTSRPARGPTGGPTRPGSTAARPPASCRAGSTAPAPGRRPAVGAGRRPRGTGGPCARRCNDGRVRRGPEASSSTCLGESRRAASRVGPSWPRRDRPEVAVGHRRHRVDGKVADDRQAGVGGRVIALEERRDVLARGRIEVFHDADRQPTVRMLRRVERLGQQPPGHAVGPIGVVLAVLVLDDPLLDLQLLIVERRNQVRHAVRFHGEDQLGVGRGDVDEVIRSIARRGSVDARPERLQVFEEVAWIVLGPLEHEVLEQVGVTPLITFFVLGTNMIP